MHHIGTLDVQQVLVETDQLQVGLGGDVVVTALGLVVLLRQISHGQVLLGHVHSQVGADCLRRQVLDLGQELRRHGDQSLSRPGVEEVNSCVHDQRREATRAHAEDVTHRREAQHDVQVGTNTLNEEGKHRFGHVGHTGGLGVVADISEHAIDLVLGEETRDPARRQDRVDVNQEALVHDLGVGHEEHDLDTLDTALLEDLSERLEQVIDSEGAGHLQLAHFIVVNEGGQTGQGLLAGTSHTNQHRVTRRVGNDATDAADVLGSLLEQHEIHHGVGLVVVHQLAVHDLLELVNVSDGQIRSSGGVGKGRVDDRLVQDVVLVGDVQLLLHHLPEDGVVNVQLGGREETIRNHTGELMNPQLHHVQLGRVVITLHEADALEDVRELTETPVVRELHRRGKELLGDLFVEHQGGLDDLRHAVAHLVGEAHHVASH
mmetsp:Transcript_61973/g.109031  ORF Transcript_61973/g.109031 Transcript_61973/m.109031 type:complete len:432 (+) Transcript_61973:2460-3755(+)